MTAAIEMRRMSRPLVKILILAFTTSILMLCLIGVYLSSASASDDAKFRDMYVSLRLAKMTNPAERGPLSRLFKAVGISTFFSSRSQRNEQRLYASGYLTIMEASDPNFAISGTSLATRVDTAVNASHLPYHGVGYGDNFCNIFCRAKDIPRVREALKAQGLSVAGVNPIR